MTDDIKHRMRPGTSIPTPHATFGTINIDTIELIEKPEWEWAHIMYNGELIGYALTKHHRATWDALLRPVLLINDDHAPFEACGRGICCMNDGHEGDCRQ